jgi:hypothetical protein
LDDLSLRSATPEHDPALLAFVKCHVTSFLRWDLLRLLSTHGERWTDLEEVARALRRPQAEIGEALAGLEAEGLLEASRSAGGATVFRLPPQEPSTRVAERLMAATTRSWELRQIIVAHVVGRARAIA